MNLALPPYHNDSGAAVMPPLPLPGGLPEVYRKADCIGTVAVHSPVRPAFAKLR